MSRLAALHTPPMSPWVVAEEAAALRAPAGAARHGDDTLLDAVLDRLADPGWDAVMHHRLGDQALWIELLRRFCVKAGEPSSRFCMGADSGSRFMAFLDRNPQATLEDTCVHAHAMAACWSATLRTPEGFANIRKGVGAGVLDELRLLFSELAPRLPQVRASAVDTTQGGPCQQTRAMAGVHLLLQSAPGLLDGFVISRLYHAECGLAKNEPAAWRCLSATTSAGHTVWKTLCRWDYPVAARARALPSEGFLLEVARLYHDCYNRLLGPLSEWIREAWLSVLRHPDATQAVLDAAHVAPEQAGSHAVVAAFAARAFSHPVTGPAPRPRPRHRG